MNKLKDKKVWAPLLGVAALVGGWYTGVGVPAEQVGEAADQVSVLAANAQELYATSAAILLGIAGWFGWKK